MRRALLIFLAVLLAGVVWLVSFRVLVVPAEDAPPETLVTVQAENIRRATLREYVTLYGTLAPEPAGQHPAAGSWIAAPIPGIVVTLHATEGERVTKGQLLVELDSRAADVAVAFAEKTLQREQALMKAGGTSARALQLAQEALDTARVQRSLLRVESPLSGTLVELNAKPGEAVDLTTVLAKVVDLSRLVVNAGVPAGERERIRMGQSAEVFAAMNAEAVQGSVSYIGDAMNPATATLPVRIALPDTGSLVPGQFVTARIVTAVCDACLVVPLDSLVIDEQGNPVVAVVTDGIATQRTVSAGIRDDGLVAIRAADLREGMQVVTRGAYALPAQTRVRVQNE